ncbi:MAG: GNAT family N-acetyltransferase [Terriglobales bacterium]
MPQLPQPKLAFAIRRPARQDEWDAYFSLRWTVLREPWARQRGEERDESEDEAIHLGAWLGTTLVGVGRAHFPSSRTAQIRYMAVLPEWQRKGCGAALLQALEDHARNGGRPLSY